MLSEVNRPYIGKRRGREFQKWLKENYGMTDVNIRAACVLYSETSVEKVYVPR
jgi:hypothetical protein